MYLLYLLALIPVFIGSIIWIFNKNVVWLEWLIGTILAFITAAVFHYGAIKSMTADIETLSGEITHAIHYPEWVEKYTVTHTRTDSKGRVSTYTTTHYRTHEEYWKAISNIDADFRISQEKFFEMQMRFKCKEFEIKRPHKSGFYSGDRNIYIVSNKTSEIHYPITKLVTWENRIKAAPTVFSFPKVPKTAFVYDWPHNPNPWSSNRVLGPTQIDVLKWDKLNADLGPKKRVNLIIVNFGNKPKENALLQEAKWLRGKKNDLILCYGGPDPQKASWAYVFGWTESELVKRNLETLLLNNQINDSLLPKIREEVNANYKIKDWSKFDYIAMEPSLNALLLYSFILLLTQGALYAFFHLNQYTKEGTKYFYESFSTIRRPKRRRYF